MWSGGSYSTSQQTGGVKQGVSNSNNAANDLSNSMYGGKGHVSLTKVNVSCFFLMIVF